MKIVNDYFLTRYQFSIDNINFYIKYYVFSLIPQQVIIPLYMIDNHNIKITNNEIKLKFLNSYRINFKQVTQIKIIRPFNKYGKLDFEELKNRLMTMQVFEEIKCTCLNCGNVFNYTENDIKINKNKKSIKSMSDLLFGFTAALKSDVIDFDRCPKCGSRNIKKGKVEF